MRRYLGIRTLRRIFTESVLVQVLNPRSALFFFAFLPQFVDPGRESAMAQALALGALFIVLALVTDSAYALFAGHLGAWLRSTTAMLKLQRTFAGMTCIVLGVARGPGVVLPTSRTGRRRVSAGWPRSLSVTRA